MVAAYIVNHSKNYTIAALASWAEYWIGYMIFGRYKIRIFVTVVGVLLVLAGQVNSATYAAHEHIDLLAR